MENNPIASICVQAVFKFQGKTRQKVPSSPRDIFTWLPIRMKLFNCFCCFLLLLRTQSLNYYTAAKTWVFTRFLHVNIKRKDHHLRDMCWGHCEMLRGMEQRNFLFIFSLEKYFTLDISAHTVNKLISFFSKPWPRAQLTVSTMTVFKHYTKTNTSHFLFRYILAPFDLATNKIFHIW